MNDPSAVVLTFIAEFLRWNDAALARYDQIPDTEESGDAKVAAIATAREEYAQLLAKFCRPDFSGKSIAFGTPSMHDPASEQILSINVRGSRCLIKTGNAREIGGSPPEIDWEYRLTQADDRWYLESVKSVVDGRRAESL